MIDSKQNPSTESLPSLSCSVLHLVDPTQATWANLTALARLTGSQAHFSHQVVTIGGAEGESRADRAGIKRIGSIRAPLASPVSACSALHPVLRRASRDTVVHAWSSSVGFAARLAGWRGGLITTLEVAPKQSIGLQLAMRKRLLHRCGRLIVGSTLERSDWLAAGAPVGTLTIIPRPIAAGLQSTLQRQAIRQGWGVSDDMVVVASLDAPSRTIDAFRMVYVSGVASVAGGKTHLILPRSATQLERAIRFTERHDGLWDLTVDHREMPELINAIDIGIWLGGTPRTCSTPQFLEIACAQGLPVVALDDPHAVEVCKGNAGAQIVHSHATTPITRAILDSAAHLPDARTPSARLLDRHHPETWLARMEMEYQRALGHGVMDSGAASAA